MNKTYTIIILSVLLLSGVSTAFATDLISGRSILDNTIQATDLGTNVTSLKSATVTVKPSDGEWICPDAAVENYDSCYMSDPGIGPQRYTVSCTTGNVSSGGIKLVDVDQGSNIDIYGSYPSSDSSWTFDVYNAGSDTISVQLRVICI